MLADSPNARDIYEFHGVPGGCVPTTRACAPANRTRGAARRGGINAYEAYLERRSRTRRWCVSAEKGSGVPTYSIDLRWNHSASQVDEMLGYAAGKMAAPVLTGC